MKKSFQTQLTGSPVSSSRFIPFSSSPSTYKHSTDSVGTSGSPISDSVVDLSLREDMMFVQSDSPSSTLNDGTSDSLLSISSGGREGSVSKKSSGTSPTSPHHQAIAQALGYEQMGRVLKFTSHKRAKNGSSSSISSGCLEGSNIVNILNQHSLTPLVSSKAMKNGEKSSVNSSEQLKDVEVLMASNILQAPGLRNDFYSNLVSWSPRTNKVLVGLGSSAYVWSTDNSVAKIEYSPHCVTVCVSSSQGIYSIVTTANGNIFIISQVTNKVLKVFSHNSCVYVVQWVPGANSFLLGDELGVVTYFDINESKPGIISSLSKISKLECHRQQICGIQLNMNNTEVAIGANDNCCTVWDITDKFKPSLKFILPHSAAVKAMAYCPWTKSLLVTGGGTKDRNIRFWHTSSGTLLSSHYTKGQVTSLHWSIFRKEIVATYGFGDSDSPLILAKYSYPNMAPLLIVPASPSLRILSASTSPNNDSICVATNDSTVRMYKLWNSSHELISNPIGLGSGIYGSSLIDLHEGMGHTGDTIR